MNLFGKRRNNSPQSIESSIAELNKTISMLEKREQYLSTKAEKEKVNAIRNAKTNKRLAVLSLRRKAYYEKESHKLSAARLNLESQVLTIQSSTVNLDVDTVEETMDNIREQTDIAQEISEAISTPLFEHEEDDEELLAQLEVMDQEDLSARATTIPARKLPSQTIHSTPAPALDLGPTVPTSLVDSEPEVDTSEPTEAEFDDLDAMMAAI